MFQTSPLISIGINKILDRSIVEIHTIFSTIMNKKYHKITTRIAMPQSRDTIPIDPL
jgi:hypothetical protein